MSKNLDAEFQAEVEVVRRRLMGQPVTEAPDPGVVAINDFIARVLANAAAAGPFAAVIVNRRQDRIICQRIKGL